MRRIGRVHDEIRNPRAIARYRLTLFDRVARGIKIRRCRPDGVDLSTLQVDQPQARRSQKSRDAEKRLMPPMICINQVNRGVIRKRQRSTGPLPLGCGRKNTGATADIVEQGDQQRIARGGDLL